MDLKGLWSLKDDVQLMLSNCKRYNDDPGHEAYCDDAEKLQVWANRVFEEGCEAIQSAASARDKKLQSLRGS